MDVALLGIKSLPAVAGADRVVEKILENTSAENDYWIYIRKDTPGAPSCHDNLHYIQVPALRGKHLGSFSYFFLSCMHYLIKGRYRVAHVHNSDFGLFVPLLRLKSGVKVLGTFHGDPYTRQKWGRLARSYLIQSERFFAEFCHRLTSVTRLRSTAKGLWRTRPVEYVPNGVDPYWEEESGVGGLLDEIGVEQGDFVMFACGRLDPTKGLHHLLDAYERLPAAPPLVIIGDFGHDPAYAGEIDKRIEKDPRLRAHRSLLDRSRLMGMLRAARLFVFPSEYEAMSMMLLEAISCRTPLVCSDIPENVAVVGEDHPHLYSTFDCEALAHRLADALDDPKAWERAGRLFERCMAVHDWKRIAGAYEDLYRELANEPATKPSEAVVGKG